MYARALEQIAHKGRARAVHAGDDERLRHRAAFELAGNGLTELIFGRPRNGRRGARR
jgi:hypothetical protein